MSEEFNSKRYEKVKNSGAENFSIKMVLLLSVSLGWYQLWSAANPEQKKETDKSLRPAIEELKTALLRHGNELPLMMPHLSNYPNMASFPRNVPDCGGGGGEEEEP